jgi:hypothetical protein
VAIDFTLSEEQEQLRSNARADRTLPWACVGVMRVAFDYLIGRPGQGKRSATATS